jgi:peptidyl-prolyl cis-trans isomerase B (cyclophilin B)
MSLVASIVILISVLMPTKQWYVPSRPVEVKVSGDQAVHVVAIDFAGKRLEPKGTADVQPGDVVDLKAIYPQLEAVGTYVVFAVPQGKLVTEFAGTPLLVQARTAPKFAGPVGTNVIRVAPLVYARMTTNRGVMKLAFWFDVAPNTAAAFINLTEGGFYDGLIFHRVSPGFVIQGGDPTGTGFGGAGYQLPAEFSDRAHEEGAISMARTGDPIEPKGMPPRAEWANSAGSQFFICLSREKCQNLDKKYTAFGQVIEGMDVVKVIAGTPLDGEKPVQPQVIEKMEIVPATAQDNPYRALLKLDLLLTDIKLQPAAPASQPAK